MKLTTVVFVINGLGTGGAERSLAELLPGLSDSGFRPIVACLLSRPEGVQGHVLGEGFDVRFLGGGDHASSVATLSSRVRALRRLVAEERPELIHTTHFESDLAGRLAAVGSGALVVTSLVNTTYDPVRLKDPTVRRGRLAAVRAIDGWSSRHLTTHFHAITQAVKNAAAESLRVRPERITVVERGRDPTRLGRPSVERKARARRELRIAPDDQVIVCVGRREFQKGQTYLLEAMRSLIAGRPRLVLLLAGRDGSASADLDRLRSAGGLADRVRFLGHREDVPELLAAGDVFAFPSLYEGLGGAVIEAMALGLPVVASDLDAIREVVEDGRSATLVPAGASDRVASAIADLLDDREKAAAYGLRGREIFDERFTLARSTGRMIELYRGLLSYPAGPRRRARARARGPLVGVSSHEVNGG